MKKIFLVGLVSLGLCANFVSAQTTINMEKEGGIYTLPCTVNGLKLKFIFDTGASNVCISATEALFMLKNGYLKPDDFIGVSSAQIANGEIVENSKIVLKEFEFAGIKLKNVEAIVIHTMEAPLLLGQTAMAKFGEFKMNPNTGTLTILNGVDNSSKNNIPTQYATSITLKQAIKFTENEQLEEADVAFKALVANQPIAENYFYYGENYYKWEKFSQAEAMYKKGLEVKADDALCLIGLGKLMWQDGKTTEAKANFDKALFGNNSKNVKLMLEVADVYIKSEKKDIPAAQALINNVIKIDIKNHDAYILLGDSYLEMNDGSKAIENYKKAAAIDAKSVKAILRQGQLYGRSKNYNLALDYYRQAAVIDSSFAPAYREQGELYYMAKQYDKAKYYSKKYVDLTGGTISSRVRYAQFLFLSKDYKKAIEEITSLQKEDTTNNVLNRLLGYASFETGEFAKGTEAMNKFFARAPKEKNKILASDFEYLGKNYAKSGKDSLGILNLEKAITMDSSVTNLYGDIALIYSKQKRNDKAAEYYTKKIEGKKDVNINDFFNLGKAYYFGKEYVKADTAFGTVISMQPKLNLGYLWRGRAQSALDPDTKTGAAKPYYEKLIEVASVDPVKNKTDLVEAHSYMAYYYYLVAKDNAKSKESWLKVKEIDPANEKAKKALEGLK